MHVMVLTIKVTADSLICTELRKIPYCKSLNTMAQSFSPIPMTTDEIGKLLQEKYSPPTDQNKHIDYFYFRVSKEKASTAETFISDLTDNLGDGFCALVDEEWPGFIIIC